MKKIFISYSQKDKTYLESFKKLLSPLQREGLLETWDDTNIVAGTEWDASIRQALQTADIIVLLVSSDLMATDYVWNFEMKEAIARHDRGEATVIPIILRPSLWKNAPFAKLNALPGKGKPISGWSDPEEAWLEIGEHIEAVARKKP